MNAIYSTNLLAVFKRKIKGSWREPWRFGCKMGAVNAKIKLQQKEETLTLKNDEKDNGRADSFSKQYE